MVLKITSGLIGLKPVPDREETGLDRDWTGLRSKNIQNFGLPVQRVPVGPVRVWTSEHPYFLLFALSFLLFLYYFRSLIPLPHNTLFLFYTFTP